MFWLMAAKEAWRGQNDVALARKILSNAFNANPESEQIWLAACKVEAEQNNLTDARTLMARAREVANTPRVRSFAIFQFQPAPTLIIAQIWIKSAVFERQHGTDEAALESIEEGLRRYPENAKLYMIKGQIYEAQAAASASAPKGEDVKPTVQLDAKAREAYTTGTRRCPNSVPLWILASRLEERLKQPTRARVLMERARHNNPKNAELWLESVRVEQRQNAVGQARTMLARGAPIASHDRVLVSLMMPHRPARVPNVRPAVVRSHLGRGATSTKDKVDRRSQKVESGPTRHRRHRSIVPRGTTNR